MVLADRALMLDIEIAKSPDGEPHFLDDLHESLDMHQEVAMDEPDEGQLASVTDIAAFVENANAKLGGGGGE